MHFREIVQVHVCAWSSSILAGSFLQTIYFRNVWNLTEVKDEKAILLEEATIGSPARHTYKYIQFEDGMRVLQQVLRYSEED